MDPFSPFAKVTFPVPVQPPLTSVTAPVASSTVTSTAENSKVELFTVFSAVTVLESSSAVTSTLLLVITNPSAAFPVMVVVYPATVSSVTVYVIGWPASYTGSPVQDTLSSSPDAPLAIVLSWSVTTVGAPPLTLLLRWSVMASGASVRVSDPFFQIFSAFTVVVSGV